MFYFSDAPSMKKEKKRKSKKDKDAENVDSDEGKKRRESQSSQGSISPKLRVFHFTFEKSFKIFVKI